MSALALLREATRAEHVALETSGWLAGVTADRAAYAAHIAHVAAWYRSAQAAFAPYDALLGRHGFAPVVPQRLAAAEAEARALGVPPSGGAKAAFPRIGCLSSALGCAYVIEGSALGGTVIARTIGERLGWRSAFYHGRGGEIAAGWKTFCTALEAAAPRLAPAALTDAARATFAHYGRSVVAATG